VRRVLLLAAAVVLIAAPVLSESVQTFVGNTSVGPTWTRPVQGNPPTSLSTSTPRYNVQSFKLLNDSNCYIVSAQGYDGYLFIYQGSFNPASPLDNVVSGDDDGVFGIGTSYLPYGAPTSPTHLNLTAGTYYLVTTGFGTSSYGAFQNTIHCEAPGVGTATPVLVQGSCGYYIGRPVENTVCLGNRFLTEIVDVTNSSTHIGVPVRIGSIDTALFWFYNDTNWEVMLKVLNACAVNNRYWVFGGALTNQGYRIVITDRGVAGDPQKQYTNPYGTRAAAIADTTAFATCP